MKKQKKNLTPDEMITLLENRKFCAAAKKMLEKSTEWQELAPSQEEWDKKWPEFSRKVINPFVKKWGCLPSPYPELFDHDPRRQSKNAILTGRWSLIPIFPWTTGKEIARKVQGIQKAIGKKHRDAIDKKPVLIAHWLKLHDDGL